MGKDVGLRIRLERALRDEFLEACRVQDKPAAQVLREFMREYIERYHPDRGRFSTFAQEIRRKPAKPDTM